MRILRRTELPKQSFSKDGRLEIIIFFLVVDLLVERVMLHALLTEFTDFLIDVLKVRLILFIV